METSYKIKKRQQLIDEMENILFLLSYYKEWGRKIASNKSVTLWKRGEEERYCKIDEVA